MKPRATHLKEQTINILRCSNSLCLECRWVSVIHHFPYPSMPFRGFLTAIPFRYAKTNIVIIKMLKNQRTDRYAQQSHTYRTESAEP